MPDAGSSASTFASQAIASIMTTCETVSAALTQAAFTGITDPSVLFVELSSRQAGTAGNSRQLLCFRNRAHSNAWWTSSPIASAVGGASTSMAYPT